MLNIVWESNIQKVRGKLPNPLFKKTVCGQKNHRGWLNIEFGHENDQFFVPNWWVSVTCSADTHLVCFVVGHPCSRILHVTKEAYHIKSGLFSKWVWILVRMYYYTIIKTVIGCTKLKKWRNHKSYYKVSSIIIIGMIFMRLHIQWAWEQSIYFLFWRQSSWSHVLTELNAYNLSDI